MHGDTIRILSIGQGIYQHIMAKGVRNISGLMAHSVIGYYSGYAPGQWERTLQCNVVSYWLWAHTRNEPWRNAQRLLVLPGPGARSRITHWGRVTHICIVKLTIIWTNAGILLIGPLGTNFSEILFGIQTSSFKKMHLKMSSAKWRPFCLSLNVL